MTIKEKLNFSLFSKLQHRLVSLGFDLCHHKRCGHGARQDQAQLPPTAPDRHSPRPQDQRAIPEVQPHADAQHHTGCHHHGLHDRGVGGHLSNVEHGGHTLGAPAHHHPGSNLVHHTGCGPNCFMDIGAFSCFEQDCL